MTFKQMYEQYGKYTLKEIYALAKELGYEVNLSVSEDPEEYYSRVWFGREYTEEWYWDFEDLCGQAVDFQYSDWED